jgi:undecaprenyl-diphosphatase
VNLTLLQAIFLGIVQGLTEFLPISSSAHLKLAKHLLGISDGEHLLYFDLVCHSGTLLALILFLKKEILEVLQNRSLWPLFALALLPLVPAYFLLKPLRIAASNPTYLGYFLMLSSLFLFLASKKKSVGASIERKKWRDVICIGMMQTTALLPGVSRSGSTIATARLLGWDWLQAARFSFLLSIPAILGGQVLETIKLLHQSSSLDGLPLSAACYGAGFGASFALGLVGVRKVFSIYAQGNVRPFAWYCLGAGLFAWWIFHG